MDDRAHPHIASIRSDGLRLNPEDTPKYTPEVLRRVAESIVAFGFHNVIRVGAGGKVMGRAAK